MINSFHGEFSFLSNFFYSPIDVEGQHYETVEHGFQALKMLDKATFDVVNNQNTPGQAKRMARSLPCRADWQEVKVGIMLELVRAKFAQHPDLAQMLRDTKDHKLVEGNTWGDRFWGVCNGVGENYLGQILMQVRNEL